MAVTAKTLFRGAATTNTATTLYTATGVTALVTNIGVTNTSASARTFTLTLDGADLFTTTAILPNTTVFIDLKQVLAATKTIKGGASTTDVNFHISGVELA